MLKLVEELAAFVDAKSVTDTIVKQLTTRIPPTTGASVTLRLPEDRLRIVAAHGALYSLCDSIFPVKEAFLFHPLRSGKPALIHDFATDQRLPDPVIEYSSQLGIRSCLSMPLMSNNIVIGTITMVSDQPAAYNEIHIDSITTISQFLGSFITSSINLTELLQDIVARSDSDVEHHRALHLLASFLLPNAAQRHDIRAIVTDLLDNDRLTAVYQPIVRLATRDPIAFEGLSRFPASQLLGPERWFDLAHKVGLGTELELKAFRTIVQSANVLPDCYPLSINLSPSSLSDNEVRHTLSSYSGRQLIIEVTERQPIPEYVNVLLNPFRDLGIKFAVDDAGSGYASFSALLRIRPDFVKIDRELIAGIETDTAKRALVGALVQVSDEIGAAAVAEGIENAAQVQVLSEIGVQYGQGFWLGKPMSAEATLRAVRSL